ncbi:MAG: MarR family winged helix-turn-helix transcriptional regulator [Pigmentiphaga sp.]|uniref:MarR family winged helix-turn-helix transcriptional regulator n=1 Tax=Pigmentiphaga sp. TaxID=1977564 RepID=UPI0029AB0EB1|nr:MarR family winged helix-turn-helix transcriptional regulator [Pigmentiphaga sp.]MDX3906320.1 MarR family winged helix-turn-helix transcriptional regulator [Pigmentiphaga sp.]
MSTSRPLPRSSQPDACPWLDADASTAPLDLDDYPVSLLQRVASAAQQDITRVYAKAHGLTPTEWRLIARLAQWKNPPMQLSRLCRMTGVDKAQAGRVLRGLERRGLVSLRDDQAHGRRIVVDVTVQGRAIARRLFPIAQQTQLALLEVLTPQEKAAMYSGLNKLLKALGKPVLRTVKEPE